ncbi:MAG TPA: DNA primase [Clostridiales bacterium]|nr:DNA primase [Clostridiales bacterium]
MGKFYSQEWIDEVRMNNDIVDVVSEYLTLTPSGRGFVALCPFHNEKTPSFSVSPEKQIFHCFGCGVGGNVISFIMKMENMDFLEAVELLAEKAGIAIPQTEQDKDYAKKREKTKAIYQVNREAALYYYNNLLTKEGERFLDYIANRGIAINTVKSFGLGCALNRWDGLKNFLLKKGYPIELLCDAGLVVKSSKGKDFYDRFRNRIIFPIINTRNQVVAFGGRSIGDTLPKYINSPETVVYSKGYHLYGLNRFRGRAHISDLIVVEGYMDVLALYQGGFKNVVASLGTALTKHQARLIKRYAKQAFIAYDGDAAGKSATIRGLELLEKEGCKPKVVSLPEDTDPDDIIRQYGPQGFQNLLNEALSLTDFKLSIAKSGVDMDTQEGKAAYAIKASEILAGLDNAIERDIYIKKVSKETGISYHAILSEIQQKKGSSTGKIIKRNTNGNNRHNKILTRKNEEIADVTKAERTVLCLLCQNQDLIEKTVNSLEWKDFSHPLNRQLAKLIYKRIEAEQSIQPADVISGLAEQDNAALIADILEPPVDMTKRTIILEECIRVIKMHNIKRKKEKLQEELEKIVQQGLEDHDRFRELTLEIDKLNKQLKLSGGEQDLKGGIR